MKKLVATFLTTAAVFSSGLTVFAAPETMSDGTVFDAEYYAQTYPDVAAAFGTDRDALYNHYVTLGKAEGRNACAEQIDSAPAVPSAEVTAPIPVTGTTTTEVLVYVGDMDEFMLTDSRPSRVNEYPNVYDEQGNLIDFMAHMSRYTYDAQGRLTDFFSVSSDTNDIAGTATYDYQGKITKFATNNMSYDNQGLLTKAEGSHYNFEFSYNEQGKLVQRKMTWTSYPGTETTDYSYDNQGRLEKFVKTTRFGDVNEYTFTYDASGKLKEKNTYYTKTGISRKHTYYYD